MLGCLDECASQGTQEWANPRSILKYSDLATAFGQFFLPLAQYSWSIFFHSRFITFLISAKELLDHETSLWCSSLEKGVLKDNTVCSTQSTEGRISHYFKEEKSVIRCKRKTAYFFLQSRKVLVHIPYMISGHESKLRFSYMKIAPKRSQAVAMGLIPHSLLLGVSIMGHTHATRSGVYWGRVGVLWRPSG